MRLKTISCIHGIGLSEKSTRTIKLYGCGITANSNCNFQAQKSIYMDANLGKNIHIDLNHPFRIIIIESCFARGRGGGTGLKLIGA